MRPSRSILAKALALTVLAGVLASVPAFAQFYDPTLQSLGLTSDVQRSPRLLGMGGLSLVVPDRHQRIALWDFARNPAGLESADSTSSLELWPGSASATTGYDMLPGLVHDTGGFREDLSGRSANMPFELVHRDGEGNAYGVTGSLGGVHSDQPYDDQIETRLSVTHPEAMPFLSGPLPWFAHGKLHYALSMLTGDERVHTQYRGIVTNAGGQFITLDGETVTAPSYFLPTDYDVRTFGINLAASYPLGASNLFAINVGQRGDRFQGTQNDERSNSQISESRPTNIGQATLIGHLGKSLEYGLDGHLWSAQSQQNWVFSISSGSGIPPLASRGKLLERDARGTSFNSHARLTAGRFEYDAQAWTNWSRVRLTPPDASDPSSFNRFLNVAYFRVGADTLALPDSVVANEQQDHAVGFAGGASWKLRRGIAGVEYHWSRDAFGQTYGGTGPRRLGWDVRGGVEWNWTALLSGRLGAGYGWSDADDYTQGNEWTTRTGSVGLGVHPPGTHWSFDAGYSLAWDRSDFGDPLNHRGSRQHLESLLSMNF